MSRIQSYLPPLDTPAARPAARAPIKTGETTPFVVPSIDTPSINPSPKAAAVDSAARATKADSSMGIVDVLSQARAEETTATDLSARFAAGDPAVGIHEAMIASEKASISVRFAVTLKNRAVEAYKEILNTPV